MCEAMQDDRHDTRRDEPTVDLRLPVDRVIKALMSERILATYAGKTVLRLLPPLVIPEVELSQVVAAITQVLTDISREIGHAT